MLHRSPERRPRGTVGTVGSRRDWKHVVLLEQHYAAGSQQRKKTAQHLIARREVHQQQACVEEIERTRREWIGHHVGAHYLKVGEVDLTQEPIIDVDGCYPPLGTNLVTQPAGDRSATRPEFETAPSPVHAKPSEPACSHRVVALLKRSQPGLGKLPCVWERVLAGSCHLLLLAVAGRIRDYGAYNDADRISEPLRLRRAAPLATAIAPVG